MLLRLKPDLLSSIVSSDAIPPEAADDLAADGNDLATGREDASGRSPAPWSPFDPDELPTLPEAGQGAGGIVAVLADVEVIEVSWTTSACLQLARSWAGAARAVVLVDLDLEGGALTRSLGALPDDEAAPGLAEVLTARASVAEATRRLDEHVFVVPCGTRAGERDAPKPGGVHFDTERWRRFCHALADAGLNVVAYVPADAPWASDASDLASDLVVLTSPDRAERFRTEAATDRVRAVLGPMRAAVSSSRGGTRSTPLLAFDPLAVPPSPLRPTSRPRKTTGVRGARPARSASAATLVAVLLVGGAALVWGMGNGPVDEPLAAEERSGREPVRAMGPRPAPVDVRYSVAAGSFGSNAAARARAREIAGRTAGLSTHVVPVRVGDGTFHRVLVGLVPDAERAIELAGLLSTILGVDAEDLVVRESHLVFDLGEASTPVAAAGVAEELAARGIPASVARVPYSDGSVRYRVVAGGYADATEAAYLADLIEDAGLEARLVPRMGLPPS